MTALMMTAENGHHECVSILVANGADVDAVMEVVFWIIEMIAIFFFLV
jgi:hypothetical protein